MSPCGLVSDGIAIARSDGSDVGGVSGAPVAFDIESGMRRMGWMGGNLCHQLYASPSFPQTMGKAVVPEPSARGWFIGVRLSGTAAALTIRPDFSRLHTNERRNEGRKTCEIAPAIPNCAASAATGCIRARDSEQYRPATPRALRQPCRRAGSRQYRSTASQDGRRTQAITCCVLRRSVVLLRDFAADFIEAGLLLVAKRGVEIVKRTFDDFGGIDHRLQPL